MGGWTGGHRCKGGWGRCVCEGVSVCGYVCVRACVCVCVCVLGEWCGYIVFGSPKQEWLHANW